MRIIRPGIAEMRYVPERRPNRLGFVCDKCECAFEAEPDETRPVSLYANYGRIIGTAYQCRCPNCQTRLSAEKFYYNERE